MSTKDTILYAEEGTHPAGKGSSLGAYFNILNALAGVGTLGMGAVLASSGWVMLVVILVAGLVSVYTGTLLVKCMEKKSSVLVETYPDVGMASFGVIGRTVVQFCQYTIIGGGVTMYIVYAGTQMQGFAQFLHYEAVNRWMFILAAGIVVWLPLVSLKTVREVAWISAMGGIATLLAVIICVSLCFNKLPSQTNVEYDVFVIKHFADGLAIISFAYGGTMIFPHVYRSMAKPQQWNFTVTAAILTASLMYLIMSSVGYATFGKATKNPIFNHFDGSGFKWAAALLLGAHVLCAGTVFLCSLCLEIERFLSVSIEQMGRQREFCFRAIIRSSVLAGLVLTGCIVNQFELIMNLVGAFSECMLVFIVPTVCHLKMFGIRGRQAWEYPVIVITLIVALVCVIQGTYNAVDAIFVHISSKKSFFS
ncbi:hypothetical protein DSO57_1027911 [Entomophthora muscae]|uniref:Uncharacterized protein n=1 Tax=Entomophthora muscae TaxID=34485 RepID=A0ACC2S3E2_9FUNG|nr:hypothetical protein DSO57_1027911 [Entomophthora muscae]